MKRLNEQKRRLFEEISRYNQIMGYIKEQQQGEANHTIRELQQLLNSKGINVGKVDNYLGPNTLNGILQALGTTSTTTPVNNINTQIKTDYTTGSNTQSSNTPPPPPVATTNTTPPPAATTPVATTNTTPPPAATTPATPPTKNDTARRVNLGPGQTDYSKPITPTPK